MAKRVTELEERALALQRDLFLLTPRQYIERDDCGPDPLGLGEAWKDARVAVTQAYFALEDLGDILRDKAGIEGWKPDDEEGWEPGDEIDTPAPSDPEPGNQG